MVTKEGKPIQQIAAKNQDEFDFPCSMTLDRDDNLLVVDHWSHNMQVFGPSGEFKLKIGSGQEGSEQGQLSGPFGVAVDLEGHYLITDHNNDRVETYTSTGVWIRSFSTPELQGPVPGGIDRPTGIDVDSKGNIYICNTGTYHNLSIFDSSWNFLRKIGKLGHKPEDTEFCFPMGVYVDRNGVIITADQDNNTIHIFTNQGMSTPS